MLPLAILAAAFLAGLATQSRAADLSVAARGAAPASGQFLLSVFDRPEGWMK